MVAQCADALGRGSTAIPQLGVLRHEHGVQRVEHGPRDIPVEVVRGQGTAVGSRPAAPTALWRWRRGPRRADADMDALRDRRRGVRLCFCDLSAPCLVTHSTFQV